MQYGINEYERAEPLGAQCTNCHTILWITGRNDPILNEDDSNIPDSGPIYREYYKNKLKRFLSSLPFCPNCHQQAYDLFVNNTTSSRFEDGSPAPKYPEEYYGVDEEMSAKVKDKAVWWYGGMVVWWYGGMVVWWYGGMVVWWYGGMVMKPRLKG